MSNGKDAFRQAGVRNEREKTGRYDAGIQREIDLLFLDDRVSFRGAAS